MMMVDNSQEPSYLEFKLLYFIVFSGLGIFMPYLPVYFESLSFTKIQIGTLCMMPKLSSFLIAPFFSMIGDSWNVHYELMMISLILSTLSVLGMMLSHVYWILAFIVLFGSIMRSPLTAQIDALVMSVLPIKTKYGEIRLWGAVSFGIFSFIGGLLTSNLDSSSSSSWDASAAAKGFRFIFYIHSICFFSSGFLLLNLVNHYEIQKIFQTYRDRAIISQGEGDGSRSKSEGKQESTEKLSVLTALSTVLRGHPEVWVFSIILLLSGFGGGVIDAFLFVRLEQLGGSGLVMGVSRFITCAAEVPMFRISGKLQERFGVWPTLAVTQFAFVVRFLYYSFLTSPWYVLPCEVLHGLTFAVMWSVSCAYASEISPKECHSTIQTILKGWHMGFGNGMGALIGGFVYDQYGAVRLFQASALLSFASFVLSVYVSAKKQQAAIQLDPDKEEYSVLHQRDLELSTHQTLDTD